MRTVRCLGLLAAMLFAPPAIIAQDLWCEMADEIHAQVQENSLTIWHQASLYNCCQDYFAYSVQEQGGTLLVEENEVPPGGLCDCICCFDLSAHLANLAAGTYLIDFRWFDYETAEWQQWLQEVTVPGGDSAARRDDPIIVFAECLDHPTDVPYLARREHDEPVAITWGALKTRYR